MADKKIEGKVNGTFFGNILSHIKLHYEYMKVAFSTAMEYKTNFFVQTTSMIINDVFWILFWVLFFDKITNIRGWGAHEVILLIGITAFAYGVCGFMFGNYSKIANIIAEGRLDFYLVLPKNQLYHVLMSRSSFYDLGDIIVGLALMILLLPIGLWPLYLVLCLLSTILFMAFGILVNSFAFWVGNMEEASRQMQMGLLSVSMYPWGIYEGAAKFILMFIIPAGFLAGIPVEILQNFSWEWLFYTAICAFVFLGLAIFVFNRGLKRYESGNWLYVRT
jgi:ABC-2 type transport system permease protein